MKSFFKQLTFFALNRLDWLWRLAGVQGVPVLMYHSVGDNPVFFTVRPEEFARQLAYLAKYDFRTVLAKEILAGILPAGQLTVALTFDDGYADNFRTVFPLLKQYGFKATIFLATEFIGREMPNRNGFPLPMLNWEQIGEMAASGLVDFQPHSSRHYDLTNVPPAEAVEQAQQSRSLLEQKFGPLRDLYAYPRGAYNPELISALKRQGFSGALTVEEGLNTPRTDPFRLKRNAIDSSTTLEQFRAKLGPAIAIFVKLFR